MIPRKVCVNKLKKNGFVLKRHGANHDIFYNPATNKTIPVKRHDFDQDDLRYIMKEAGIK